LGWLNHLNGIILVVEPFWLNLSVGEYELKILKDRNKYWNKNFSSNSNMAKNLHFSYEREAILLITLMFWSDFLFAEWCERVNAGHVWIQQQHLAMSRTVQQLYSFCKSLNQCNWPTSVHKLISIFLIFRTFMSLEYNLNK